MRDLPRAGARSGQPVGCQLDGSLGHIHFKVETATERRDGRLLLEPQVSSIECVAFACICSFTVDFLRVFDLLQGGANLSTSFFRVSLLLSDCHLPCEETCGSSTVTPSSNSHSFLVERILALSLEPNNFCCSALPELLAAENMI